MPARADADALRHRECACQGVGDSTLSTPMPIDALFSTLGRTAARTLETKVFLD
ncbi:MAG: hypothetical protein R3D59_10290 [Paracoccaceae bacterium]